MPPTETKEVSHLDIWVSLTRLDEKVGTLIGIIGERKSDIEKLSKDLDALFTRQRRIELRMGQVVIIGALIALLIPVIGGAMHLRIAVPTSVESMEPLSGPR
jgi:hypothetical protein